jgi:hypothetical protein
MKKFASALFVLSALAATPAAAVDIGGLNVPAGPVFSVTQIYGNSVSGIGDTATGYGKVDSINSTAISSLCSGCELTYRFGGYVVTSISATEVRFTSGYFNFYLGFGADKDFTTGNAGGSAGDLAEATNGSLFMTLSGHAIDAAGNTLIGTGANINTTVPTGFATGLLDVNMSGGGIANPYFDTNSVPALFGGPADLQFGSSFSGLFPVYRSECPGGPACVRGSGDLVGNVVPIPEPMTWAMMILGFAGMGMALRRRRASKAIVQFV